MGEVFKARDRRLGRIVDENLALERAEIRFMSFATGKDTRTATIEERAVFGLAAAPDNSALLYSQFDADSSELVLIEDFR